MTRIYVRMSQDGYEGQSLRFVTLDEGSALSRFVKSDEEDAVWASDYSGEELQIWEDGERVETYTRSTDKKWYKNRYSENREEYGVIKIQP